MPEDLHDFVFFSKNFDRASGTLVPFLSEAQVNKGRYATWTGHSARVGAAQDMTEAGYGLAQIMHEGTWKKPETVLGYIRNIEAQKSVMIDLVEGNSPAEKS
ncbi:hypothetical protein [Xenorhabdus sp. Sc-CR9]|uniref:hypothetical protein n=1 Tax=Xenorhabdus sp. Sc-CR9 TaxID=2584468 RepID=UPI003016AFFD